MENERDDFQDHWKTMEEVKQSLLEYHKFLETANLPEMDYNTHYLRKLQVVKAYYKAHMPYLEKHNQQYPFTMYRAYAFDWSRIFTPIEFSAWQSIRIKGGLPLYPQFPVDNYIIDFADPFKKIGLELDGKAYHDKEKDTIRDKDLRSKGWNIYRITGSEMENLKFKDWESYTFILNYNGDQDIEEEDYHDLKHWILNTGDGVIEAIKALNYRRSEHADTYLENHFLDLCRQTLTKHTLV